MKSSTADIGAAFLAFALGLAYAWMYNWNTLDLVWSLWLGSLTLGYLSIVSTIYGTYHFLGIAINKSDLDQRQRKRARALIGGSCLFSLLFFSFHFCGFHAGHSVFLQMFFPQSNLPSDGFGDYFTNPPGLLYSAAVLLLPKYGLFLIPVLIAERKNIFHGYLVQRNMANTQVGSSALSPAFVSKAKSKSHAMQDVLVGPYRNVIRMHLLIFVFAICQALHMESSYLYVLVYFLYFFPWRILRRSDNADRINDKSFELE